METIFIRLSLNQNGQSGNPKISSTSGFCRRCSDCIHTTSWIFKGFQIPGYCSLFVPCNSYEPEQSHVQTLMYMYHVLYVLQWICVRTLRRQRTALFPVGSGLDSGSVTYTVTTSTTFQTEPIMNSSVMVTLKMIQRGIQVSTGYHKNVHVSGIVRVRVCVCSRMCKVRLWCTWVFVVRVCSCVFGWGSVCIIALWGERGRIWTGLVVKVWR